MSDFVDWFDNFNDDVTRLEEAAYVLIKLLSPPGTVLYSHIFLSLKSVKFNYLNYDYMYINFFKHI